MLIWLSLQAPLLLLFKLLKSSLAICTASSKPIGLRSAVPGWCNKYNTNGTTAAHPSCPRWQRLCLMELKGRLAIQLISTFFFLQSRLVPKDSTINCLSSLASSPPCTLHTVQPELPPIGVPRACSERLTKPLIPNVRIQWAPCGAVAPEWVEKRQALNELFT